MTTPELPALPGWAVEGEKIADDGRYVPLYDGDDVEDRDAVREARERILMARIAELEADRDAARRERDDAIEEKEAAQLEVAYLANEMIYEGNSIGWIASKAKNYGAALGDAWSAVKAVGGVCDGATPLHVAIRQQLVAIDAARGAK